tara:strand:+ start:1078 stop:1920 length:843 start_codon:yes stop_codon:yes gene_type:complete
MSISSITSNIDRFERDIATLEKQKSSESDKELRVLKNIDSLTDQANRTTSQSTIKSKLSQIRTKQTELGRIEKKKAEISKKLADKNKQLRKYQIDLTKEQTRERKKTEKEQLDFQRNLSREIERQKQLTHETIRIQREEIPKTVNKEYDVFISHSSADKEEFVRPLALELQKLGLKVWYDEFELKLGDSLRRSIDQGLINSRYGIVVLSSSFFKRNWTNYELDGFVNKEMNGLKVILPIWHKVSKDEVQKFSLSLADKVALNSSIYSVKEIAEEINDLIK